MARPLELANQLVDVASLGKGFASPLCQDDATGDFKTVEGHENVRVCIRDLITTRIGTRVMNEDIGTEVLSLLFENIKGVVDILPFHLKEAIERHEPRVRDVQVRAQQQGDTAVEAYVSWVVRSTNRRDSLVHLFSISGE
jgi:phage baseplate assembly protein W